MQTQDRQTSAARRFDDAVVKTVAAARQTAERIGVGITMALCDSGGHLLALHRHRHALLASLESAQSKARTSVYFGVESRHLPGQSPITPALLAAVPLPLAFLPGGVPLRDDDGALAGALGVGGGTPDQDQVVAEAAAAAWAMAITVRGDAPLGRSTT